VRSKSCNIKGSFYESDLKDLDKNAWSASVVPISGPDDLREIGRGSDTDIVQLKPGKLRGCIKHFGVGNLQISLGRFNSGIRVRGPLHQERVVLGAILESGGRITQWWKDVRPGDVGVFPALQEIDVVHGGSAAYLLVSIGVPELSDMLGGEEQLADPLFWNTKRLCNIDPLLGAEVVERLMGIVSGIERQSTAPTDQAIDFLQRSIIESYVMGLTSMLPQANAQPCTGARLVKETEDYIDAAQGRPVHISELCSALKVSRRSLHRAFADTMDMGPAAYLRCRRLSAIQSILRRCDPATVSIGELAFEHGFVEPGRFASYYRAHFGETPSETVRSRWASARSL
jgi:AraC family ethanolamine operon transcriptional activator